MSYEREEVMDDDKYFTAYVIIRTTLMNELNLQKLPAGAIARVILNDLQKNLHIEIERKS